jgi:hypothetical protein
MKRFLIIIIVISMVSLSAFAQNSTNASAKAAASYNTVTVCDNNTVTPCTSVDTKSSNAWYHVMGTQIKTNNVNDLFVGVSLVTGLYTKTQVKGNTAGSQTLTGSTAVAQGTVEVKVVLDSNEQYQGVFPGPLVTFDERIQTLNASIGNIFTDCFANKVNDPITNTATCDIIPEQITLILQTSGAHSFNWVLPNVGVGPHRVDVYAKVSTDTTGTDPGNVAVANALFGLGTMTVESVRMNNALPLTVY